MPLLMRRTLPIAILVAVAVIAVISLGEGFKVLKVKRHKVKLTKRDGSTFSLSMPWSGSVQNAKAINPVAVGMVDSMSNVANSILHAGTSIANAAIDDANHVASVNVLDAQNAVSIVANILNGATAILGVIVGDATSIVGSDLSGAAGGASTSEMFKPKATTSDPTTSLSGSTQAGVDGIGSSGFDPIGSMPPTGAFPASPFKLNITSIVSNRTPLAGSSVMMPFTSSLTAVSLCQDQKTVTCYTTETWHSTHYEKSITLYSFRDVLTITETMSACPQSTNFGIMPSFPPSTLVHCWNGNTVQHVDECNDPPNPCPETGLRCTECPGGWFCPPLHTAAQPGHCGMGWACAHCGDNWFCPDAQTSTLDLDSIEPVTSLPSSIFSGILSSSVQPSIETSLLTSYSQQHPQTSQAGLFPQSTSLSSQFATTITQSGGGHDLTYVISALTSILGGIPGFPGGYFNTIIAQVASVASVTNSIASDLPTGAVRSLVSTASRLPTSGLSISDPIQTVFPISVTPPMTTDIATKNNGAQGGLHPTMVNVAGGNIISTALSIANGVSGSNPTIPVYGAANNLLSPIIGLTNSVGAATTVVGMQGFGQIGVGNNIIVSIASQLSNGGAAALPTAALANGLNLPSATMLGPPGQLAGAVGNLDGAVGLGQVNTASHLPPHAVDTANIVNVIPSPASLLPQGVVSVQANGGVVVGGIKAVAEDDGQSRAGDTFRSVNNSDDEDPSVEVAIAALYSFAHNMVTRSKSVNKAEPSTLPLVTLQTFPPSPETLPTSTHSILNLTSDLANSPGVMQSHSTVSIIPPTTTLAIPTHSPSLLDTGLVEVSQPPTSSTTPESTTSSVVAALLHVLNVESGVSKRGVKR